MDKKKKPKQSTLKKAYNLTIFPYAGKAAGKALKKASMYTIYPYATKAVKKRTTKSKSGGGSGR